MLRRVIQIEYRPPETKYEKKFYGITDISSKDNAISKVFINSLKKRNGEAMNTFFHEMVHVWLGQFHAGKKLSAQKEEHMARLIGNAVEALLKT